MPMPTTRLEFKEYCLRKLGKPVIEINLDDDQIEDRIDEALSYYQDYHYDGTEKTYLKHQVTAADITNGWIPIPESIIGVVDLFNIGDSYSTNSMFNIRYQMTLNDVWNMADFSLTNYVMSMEYIQFMETVLVGKQPLRFNRHTNKLFIDMDWRRVFVGQYIIAVCYVIVDPNTYADVWKDRWLLNYSTAKIKENWGESLTKYEGMQMPGGVTFNGAQKLSEAREDILRLEEQMQDSYSLPALDMIG